MDKEIEISGKKIFYRVYGSGKLVILLHGFGETGDVWKNQAPSNSPGGGELASTQNQPAEDSLLKDKFMFIVPDLPGSGKSEMIEDMSMEGMAEVIKVIIDAEMRPPQTPPEEGLRNTQSQLIENSLQEENSKILESSKVLPFGEDLGGAEYSQVSPIGEDLEGAESSKIPPSGGGGASLIGHSMGGYITLSFAEKYSGYLNAFGLFHSTAYPDNEEKKITRRKGIEFIKENGAFEFLKTATPNLFSADTKQRFPELIDQFIQSLNNFSPEALVSYYESMIKRPDRTHVLKNAKMPILFILGKYDNAVPLEDGLKQCHLPEKSYIHILHQSGHMGMLEEADKSNRILEKFLSEK